MKYFVSYVQIYVEPQGWQNHFKNTVIDFSGEIESIDDVRELEMKIGYDVNILNWKKL
jgi:hypothetical protein